MGIINHLACVHTVQHTPPLLTDGAAVQLAYASVINGRRTAQSHRLAYMCNTVPRQFVYGHFATTLYTSV